MQQLLQMMQKISAEPNNNAQVQPASASPQINLTDSDPAKVDSVESEPVEVEPVKSETAEAETVEAESVESETAEGEPVEGDSEDVNSPESEMIAGNSEGESDSDGVDLPEIELAKADPIRQESVEGESAVMESAEGASALAESADINSVDEPVESTEQDAQSLVEMQCDTLDVEVQPVNNALITTNNDVAESELDESAIDEVVVDNSAGHAVPEKGGIIKRWIKKAVSWIKRLVGF